MTLDQWILLVSGYVLIIGSPLATIGVIVYLILRDALPIWLSKKDDEQDEQEDFNDPLH